MFVSRHPWDLTWYRRWTSGHDIRLALLYPMLWPSKRRLCFVQVDQEYQPRHKRRSLPLCGPYLATSNISSINKVNTKYNGRCSEKNLSPLPAGKYGKSTKHSTRRLDQANQGQSGLEAERVRALGALHSLRFKMKLVVGKRREKHFLSNEEKEKWIEDCVERETAVARKRVEDAEIAIEQQQDDMRNAEKAGLTITKPEKTFQKMLNAIGDSLSDLARSDNQEDGEDEDDDEGDPAEGKLSEDHEPGWMMSTISQTVQYRMERFWQKQMKLDELTQPHNGDAADYLRERDKKYWTTELKVLAVVQPQTADDAASSVPTTFSEPLETLHCVPGEFQMPQGTPRPGSSHMRLRSQKPQTHERIPSLPPAPMPDWLQIQQTKHVEPVSCNPCVLRPMIITI